MHIIILPVADIAAAVLPSVNSAAGDLVFLPLADVAGAVGPPVVTEAVFLVSGVLAGKRGTFLPLFFTHTMSHITEELTQVCRAFLYELPLTTGLIIPPLALILRSVCPLHTALPVSHSSEPLAVVFGERFVLVGFEGCGAICVVVTF